MPLHNSGAVGVKNTGKYTVGKITNRNTFHTIVKTFGTLESDKAGTDDQYITIFVDCFFKCKGSKKTATAGNYADFFCLLCRSKNPELYKSEALIIYKCTKA